MCGDRVNSVYLGQYHGCWCPGSLRRRHFSSHDIDYIEYLGPSLIWGSVLSTCVKSMWSNDIKCKYMIMFPLKNLARKGLNKRVPTKNSTYHLPFIILILSFSVSRLRPRQNFGKLQYLFLSTHCTLHSDYHWRHQWMLTQWGQDKMAAISQTIFSDHFHEWKVLYFD